MEVNEIKIEIRKHHVLEGINVLDLVIDVSSRGTDIAGAISELSNQLTRLETSIRALGIENRSNESRVGRLLNINT